jgi:hypothetical protein
MCQNNKLEYQLQERNCGALKRIAPILICFLLTISACKKNTYQTIEEPTPIPPNPIHQSYSFDQSFKGTLYDQQTGNAIAGKTINVMYLSDGYPIKSAQITTDSNGEFSCTFQWQEPYVMHMPLQWYGWFYTSFDSIAGAHFFSRNDYGFALLHADIYARPNGYLALTLVDTSQNPSFQVRISKAIVGVIQYDWKYNAQQNGYADTTKIFTIYGNSKVGIYNIPDSLFIPSNDTVYATIKY